MNTKYNQKLEGKFFGPFYMLYLIGKQVYKLEIPKNRKFAIFFIYHRCNRILAR